MNKTWALCLIAIFAIGFGLKSYWSTQQASQPPLPTFELLAAHPDSSTLFDVNDSRIRIVYFGFTRCPDVCPTSLAMLAGALAQLDEPVLAQVRPIFISLDPERDDAQSTATYAKYFHPLIEGFSFPIDITQAMATQYGVIFHKTELPNSTLRYTLDHSSYFYLLQPNGALITQVPHTETPEPIVAAIQKTITSLTEGQ